MVARNIFLLLLNGSASSCLENLAKHTNLYFHLKVRIGIKLDLNPLLFRFRFKTNLNSGSGIGILTALTITHFRMGSENSRLTQTIRNLEKDIGELKREIHGRDEAIGEKEKRIADLG